MNILDGITFANPQFLWLLCIVPLLLVYQYFYKEKRQPVFTMSSLEGFKGLPMPLRVYLRKLMPVVRALAIAALIVAIARPQSSTEHEDIDKEGIDIVLAIDISGSMRAGDLKPSRIEASKSVIGKFIDGRPYDRIAMVIFESESFTLCPLTTDHNMLKTYLKQVNSGMLQDGTAIGMGLATAINRLRESDAKSKVIILLTDGANNAGNISPLAAAEMAKDKNIRVYTIGVGSQVGGMIPIPGTNTYTIADLDEPLLKQIASATGGKYFRATDSQKLSNIYSEIDKLEKIKIEQTASAAPSEEFYFWAIIAGILLLSEMFFHYTIFKTIT